MSRQRMIQPEFWSDESVNECSVSARLLFIATWNFSDDEGNLIRSAKQLKAQAFPYDNINCEPLILELIKHGLLNEYSVSDKKYLNVANFKKHQKINRPSKPQCPLYEHSLSTHSKVSKEVSKEVSMDQNLSTPKKPLTILVELGVTEQVAKDWLTIRKSKKAPFTETALNELKNEAAKAGITAAQAVEICARKSWQGFNATWKWQDALSIKPNELGNYI